MRPTDDEINALILRVAAKYHNSSDPLDYLAEAIGELALSRFWTKADTALATQRLLSVLGVQNTPPDFLLQPPSPEAVSEPVDGE